MPSKLSLFTSWHTPQAMDFVRRAKPPLVKIMDTFGHEAEVKSASPDAVIVGRAYEAQQGMLGQGEPVAEARAFFQRQVEKYQTHREVDYWEGWNEPVASSAEEMAWYAAFEVERVRLLAEIGVRACIGNFSVGCPSNLNWWPYFFPALRAAKQNKGVLGLHEYGWPWMDNYFGKNQINPKEDEGDTGWTTGRYRKVYRNFLIPNGLVLPLIITECGIDCVNVTGQDPRYLGVVCGGWRKMGAWWSQHGGLNDPAEEYLRQLAWYDSLLQADAYVIGATLFHLGVTGWGDHDLSGPMAERLTQYCVAQRLAEAPVPPQPEEAVPDLPVPPPPPAPQPITPPRGEPREPYGRTYVLLPPNATLSLTQTAARRFFGPRYTLGYSADDAGMGDLDSRTVIAVDPEQWGGDLRAWFAQYYPGVNYQSLRSSEL